MAAPPNPDAIQHVVLPGDRRSHTLSCGAAKKRAIGLLTSHIGALKYDDRTGGSGYRYIEQRCGRR